jgi:DNA/RNA-binding domain of Phe-tRNA-synthetase-like protein
MISITISKDITSVCPDFKGAAILASVINNDFDKNLWQLIDEAITEYQHNYTIENIKQNPAIAATRSAYKKLGKDPNRYRPAAESLCRRILKDKSLYKVNTLVDLINLVSIKSGYSIGGFDYDKIEGNSLTLGVGELNEPYEGIGRGTLNIEGLPVYRDEIGGIGTPTSDNERTKLDITSTRLLTIINAYNGKEGLEDTVDYMKSLLEEFTSARDIEVLYFE